MPQELNSKDGPSVPGHVASTEGLGSTREGQALLHDLLRGPYVPQESADLTAEEQHAAANAAIRRQVFDRLAAAVAGTTRGGKLNVLQMWHDCWLTAYVVERRGRGLLVQADDVQAWLPADKVYVLNATTISIPEWLLRRRAGEFRVLDCREGERPRLSWNSAGGEYHG